MLRLMTVLTVLLATPALGAAQSLEGVWRGTTQVIIGGPDDGQVTQFTQYRLLIYTKAFFTWVFLGEGDRPLGGSDAEIVQATQQFNTAAGTYIRDGVNIIYNRRASTNPNGEQPENQPLVRQIRALTANTLVTQVTNAEGVTALLVYQRVE